MSHSAHAIVLGNEKGGTGKSTTAMHIAVSLMRDGHRVGVIDLDARQGTLSRYFGNRGAGAVRRGLRLPTPDLANLNAVAGNEADPDKFLSILGDMAVTTDFVVIDCPGHDSPLSRLAHNFADTLITPLNDSFIDLDNLADVDPADFSVRGPSRYAEAIWEARKHRMLRDRGEIDWIVMRNRLSQLDARNKRRVGDVLLSLKDRIKFRIAPGLSERVIYRELFLDGLTLLDVMDRDTGVETSMSHVAARAELRALMTALNLPEPGGPTAG